MQYVSTSNPSKPHTTSNQYSLKQTKPRWNMRIPFYVILVPISKIANSPEHSYYQLTRYKFSNPNLKISLSQPWIFTLCIGHQAEQKQYSICYLLSKFSTGNSTVGCRYCFGRLLRGFRCRLCLPLSSVLFCSSAVISEDSSEFFSWQQRLKVSFQTEQSNRINI